MPRLSTARIYHRDTDNKCSSGRARASRSAPSEDLKYAAERGRSRPTINDLRQFVGAVLHRDF